MRSWLIAITVMAFGFMVGVCVGGLNMIKSGVIVNKVVSLDTSIDKQNVVIDKLVSRIGDLEKQNTALEKKISTVSSDNKQIKQVIGAITQLIGQIIQKINELDERGRKFSL
jgi:peptidoglycan hydrolase CwlO-like protein